MIEIATKNKDRIRTLKPAPLSQLEEQLEDLQVRIDDRELQFRKEGTPFPIQPSTPNTPRGNSWQSDANKCPSCVRNAVMS
jgi:hypothetical protein